MAKHTYRITINQLPASREPIEYKYSNIPCTLTCSNGSASVYFETNSKWTQEDLISFQADLAEDALRKMYLLHAMRFDSQLGVRTVTVTIDGESELYRKGYPGFPFLHSMLTAKSLGLPESWRDQAFIAAVLSATKSKAENDHRYACLFSFLAGTSKIYESEKFTCYWTAVNALYNQMFTLGKPFYAAERGAARFEDLSKDTKKAFSGDAKGINALMRLTESGTAISSQPERETKFKEQYEEMKALLGAIPKKELPELHRQLWEHRTDKDWFPEGPLGDHLRSCCSRHKTSAWGFLCFDYAYYIRCNYLHGSKSAILFTYSSAPELADFRVLNLFLGEFLREMIPMIFRDGWFTQVQYRNMFSRQ